MTTFCIAFYQSNLSTVRILHTSLTLVFTVSHSCKDPINNEWGWDLAYIVVTASDCQCQGLATVLGSIPASSDTVKSEGRQMKQCWKQYIEIFFSLSPPVQKRNKKMRQEGRGPQSDKHLPRSPFTGKYFFRWRHFALLSISVICLRSEYCTSHLHWSSLWATHARTPSTMNEDEI